MANFFPVIELIDRYIISKIKIEKNLPNNNEFNWYQDQLNKFDLTTVQPELIELEKVHLDIWNLEADLKSGQEQNIPLEEIGRRAIQIRNLNNKRVSLKNSIAEKLNCKVREFKSDHLSE